LEPEKNKAEVMSVPSLSTNSEELNSGVKTEGSTAPVFEDLTTPVSDSAGNESGSSKPKRKLSIVRVFSSLLIILSLIVILTGGLFVYNILMAASETTGGGEGNFWNLLLNNFLPKDFERIKLKGEDEGRTNVLVIGYDSVAMLADSILIVSYYYTEKKVVTLSIPRDFYIRDGGGAYKINALYPFAEQRQKGSGAQAMADFLSRELDIPIHYWVALNFQGVKQLVNAAGGIEINVTVPFVDYEFPTDDYSGYLRPAPSFEAGRQYMDGDRALIYARSRHGNNGTGSDFDRSRRQAEVGAAILQKLQTQLRSGEIWNINSINALINSVRGNLKTSAEVKEIISAYEIFKTSFKGDTNILENFYSINFRTGNGFLCSPPLDLYGASVITYCDGTLGGSKGASKSREQARQIARDLLQQAKFAALREASVIILANRSDKTAEVEKQLQSMPVGKVWPADNFYKYIPKATGEEVIRIYIADAKLREQFAEASKGKLEFAFELHGPLPAEKYLTPNNVGADIIVWIE
jgi:LCP family protein required for cell wall assembly